MNVPKEQRDELISLLQQAEIMEIDITAPPNLKLIDDHGIVHWQPGEVVFIKLKVRTIKED